MGFEFKIEMKRKPGDKNNNLKEMLEKIKNTCVRRGDCSGCPLRNIHGDCLARRHPANWEIDEMLEIYEGLED